MVKRWKIVDEKYNFTKTDYERLGFLKEGGYITIKDPYVSRLAVEKASKKKQFLPTGTHIPDGTQLGYFQPNYLRIMEGECYSDPISLVRQFRLKQSEKFLADTPYISAHGRNHIPCGIGSFCATINPSPPSFSPKTRPPKHQRKVKRNLYTSPGKKGTGYGYANVTLSKYLHHADENFNKYQEDCEKAYLLGKAKMMNDYFRNGVYKGSYFWKNPYTSDVPLRKVKEKKQIGLLAGEWKHAAPGKLDGGMKAGTFTPYPEHSKELYKQGCIHPQNQMSKYGFKYLAYCGTKSTVTRSVMSQNVDKYINNLNYTTKHAVMDYQCPRRSGTTQSTA